MLDNICFRDECWLNSNILNEHTALDYFATSQFYDKQCNNEILRMQTQFSNLSEIKSRLEEMVGIEYVLSSFKENLFIIYQINRRSKGDWDVLGVFYILMGNIYMAPTNISVYETRIANSIFYLNEAIDKYVLNWKFDPFISGESITPLSENNDIIAAKIINDFNK